MSHRKPKPSRPNRVTISRIISALMMLNCLEIDPKDILGMLVNSLNDRWHAAA